MLSGDLLVMEVMWVVVLMLGCLFGFEILLDDFESSQILISFLLAVPPLS